MTRARERQERYVGCLMRALVVLLVATALAVGLAAWALFGRAERPVQPGRPVRVEIPSGASTARIGALLAREGIVANRYAFRAIARLRGLDGRLAPGVYELSTGMRYGDVLARLTSGPPVELVSVTIPEGFTVEQIAERLEQRLGIPRAETLALARTGAAAFQAEHPYLKDAHNGSLEGYLFPKTYRFARGTGAGTVLKTMLEQFDKEIQALDIARARAEGFTLHEVVTMASIIEREAALDRERPLIASVIRNRLARGMPLEIDATVEYVLPGHRFRLRYKDLRIDSPYNTYRVRGLPPGPIANPGIASLRAAVAPARTRYLYYVLTGRDGSHTFTTNKRDFLRAKQRSKEVFGR